jgi:hypothetical protein
MFKTMIKIPIKGAFTLVSLEDADVVNMALYYGGNGYAYVEGGRKYLHHLIADRLGLTVAEGQVRDHINGDRLDNRRENLRVVSHGNNVRCKHVQRADNTSGYAGVSYDYARSTDGKKKYVAKKPWFAKLQSGGRQFYLGRYKTVEEAASAHAAVAELVFGQFAPTTLLPAAKRIKAAELAGLAHYRKRCLQ